METHIRSFQTLKDSLNYDTNVKDHINNLELKFNKMLQEIQHPIHSYIVNKTDLTQTSNHKDLAANNNKTKPRSSGNVGLLTGTRFRPRKA
jgi:hypothetical protein